MHADTNGNSFNVSVLSLAKKNLHQLSLYHCVIIDHQKCDDV